MASKILCSILFVALQLLSANAKVFIRSTCSGLIPVVNDSGPGCSIPAFVNASQFGDNLRSQGRLFLRTFSRGSLISIRVDGLSRFNLVLTAWFIWVNPDTERAEIFNIASTESPVAPSFGSFTSGAGSEANRLRYFTRSSAFLRTFVDFNPTRPNSGPLVGARPSFQSDIPGIEDTDFQQFNATADGRVIPVSANFLRVFDPETGFQKLDSRGRPQFVRSPNAAYGISVVAHIDRTTHGLSAGLTDADRFEVLFFNLTRFARE